MSDLQSLIDRVRLGRGGKPPPPKSFSTSVPESTGDPFTTPRKAGPASGRSTDDTDPFASAFAPRLGLADPFSSPPTNTAGDLWSSPLSISSPAFTTFTLPTSAPSFATSGGSIGGPLSFPALYVDDPWAHPLAGPGTVPGPADFPDLSPIPEETGINKVTNQNNVIQSPTPRRALPLNGQLVKANHEKSDPDDFFGDDDDAWVSKAVAAVAKVEREEEKPQEKPPPTEPKIAQHQCALQVKHALNVPERRASPYFTNGRSVDSPIPAVTPNVEDRPPSRCSSAANVRFPKLGSRPPSAQSGANGNGGTSTPVIVGDAYRPGHYTNKKQIEPISVYALDTERERRLFKFTHFNAMQSAVFHSAYRTDENLVVSAPTGSGKTTVFELAFFRMLSFKSLESKSLAIYVAPTKALCSERSRDWKERFGALGVEVREVTGDTGVVDSASNVVGDARLVVTTPEKWDSVTRRKSSKTAIENLELMMVDEVHTLNEERGATLEVLVARMKAKRLGSLRFVAVSATVPNIDDVARWLGSRKQLISANEDESPSPADPSSVSSIPKAQVFTFSDGFRPVPLEKFTIGVEAPHDFALISKLEKQLFTVLNQHSKGLPTLVFCPTRKACQSTAEQIYKEYESALQSRTRVPWDPKTNEKIELGDPKLTKWSEYGIAVHHAGLELLSRRRIESAFIESKLHLIVATSTLAVGVNLPAHLVVIQGTSCWAGAGTGFREYSDIDIQQMMGRAGRPQYDTSGTVVIMCQQSKLSRYKSMLASNTILESCLHQHLTEHLNSEISLGTISSVKVAQDWLRGTFLSMRIRQNPGHYQAALVKDHTKSWDETLDRFAENALADLKKIELITDDREEIVRDAENEQDAQAELAPTRLGKIMSTNFVSYRTMCHILTMSRESDLRALMEILAGATEFSSLRIRQGEGAMLNKLREHEQIRFRLDQAKTFGDKVFLLLQATLANVDLEELGGKTENGSAKTIAYNIFQSAPRIAKAILAVASEKQYGPATCSALQLVRTINGKAWEDASTVFRQIHNIGPKSMTVLESNAITTFDEFINLDPGRLGMWLNRNVTFAYEVIEQAKQLPRFTVEFFEEGMWKNEEGYPTIKLCLHIKNSGNMIYYKTRKGGATKKSGNKKNGPEGSDKAVPTGYNIAILLLSSKDSRLIDFYANNTKHLNSKPGTARTNEVRINVTLYSPDETVYCHVGVEERAGLSSKFHYKPDISAEEFPVRPVEANKDDETDVDADAEASSKTAKGAAKRVRSGTPLFLPSDDESVDELIDLTETSRPKAGGTKRRRSDKPAKAAEPLLRKVKLSAARFIDDEAIDDDDEDALDELDELDDGGDLDDFVVPDKPAKRARVAPTWSTAAKVATAERKSPAPISMPNGKVSGVTKTSSFAGSLPAPQVPQVSTMAASKKPTVNRRPKSSFSLASPEAGPSRRQNNEVAQTIADVQLPPPAAAKTEDDEFQELFGEFFS